MPDVTGVQGLQPPPGRPGHRPGTLVGTRCQHLGADEFDLLAGPVDLRPDPQRTLGGNRPQQIDGDPAQPGVVPGLVALQCTHQQRRNRCGVLDLSRPGAANQIGGAEFRPAGRRRRAVRSRSPLCPRVGFPFRAARRRVSPRSPCPSGIRVSRSAAWGRRRCWTAGTGCDGWARPVCRRSRPGRRRRCGG